MNLDDLLRERRARLQQADRVLPVSDRCLALVDLERLAEEPDSIDEVAAAHLRECDRCRTLRDAIGRRPAGTARRPDRTHAAAVSVAVRESRSGHVWKVLVLVGPYVAAACLWVAVMPALRASRSVTDTSAAVRLAEQKSALRYLDDGMSLELKRLAGQAVPLLEVQRGPVDANQVEDLRKALGDALETLGKMSARVHCLAEGAPPSAPESSPARGR